VADTPFKGVPVPAVRVGQPAAALSFPRPLNRGPWIRAIKSQDTVLAGRRIVLSVDGGGSLEWQVGNDATGTVSQNYPDPALWRTVAETQFELAAGNCLELRALALPSGATETFDGGSAWPLYGVSGAIRLTAVYHHVDGVTPDQTIVAEKAIPAALGVDGLASVEPGGAWGQVIHIHIPNIKPAGNTPEDIAARSEWPRVHLTLEYRGGARVISCNVQEVPDQHIVEHDAADTTLHDAPAELGIPFKKPQLKGPDGATYDDNRFGPRLGFNVAARQTRRLGPQAWYWSCRTERLDLVTSEDPVAVQFSNTADWSSLMDGTSEPRWNADAPGWDLCAAYCKAPNNLHSRMRGNAAVLPMRVWVYARFTTNAGVAIGKIRFASSARSSVIVRVPETTTWTWITTTTFLEANVTSRDAACIVQVHGIVSAGTMELRYHAGEYGHYPIAPV
jgi:hypothetical protein